MARRWLATELQGLLPQETVADAAVVVAELVSNAIRHADSLPGGVIRVSWRLRTARGIARELEIRVSDGGSPATPEPQQTGPDALSGRGLGIVAALALRWGVARERAGHCVWAVLGVVRGPRSIEA
jgi:anti-sigma regulatory factor (Ser/Thr protein kinase)